MSNEADSRLFSSKTKAGSESFSQRGKVDVATRTRGRWGRFEAGCCITAYSGRVRSVFIDHFNSLFDSISNHMAKSVNWLPLMNEKKVASALMGGI